MRTLLERRHLAVPHLVQDAAGVLVAEVVDPAPLPLAERTQGGRRERRREGERLQAREDAVAAEHRHEPRQAGGREALPPRHGRREAKGREVDQASPVRRPQRIPVALDPRRFLDPLLEALAHVRPGPTRSAPVLRAPTCAREPREDGRDVEIGRPLAVRLDLDAKAQPVPSHPRGLGGRAVGSRVLRDALLDHVAITATDGDQTVEVPQRLVQAVARMGFAGADDDAGVRVLAGGAWIGLAAAYGVAWWRRPGDLFVAPAR